MRKLIAAGVAALAACAGVRDAGCTRLPEGGRYCLQPTASVAPFHATQHVEVALNGAGLSLLSEIEVDAAAMHLVILAPYGQTLMQLNYDNHAASMAGTGPLNSRVDPVLVAALVQLALWPLKAVRAGLTAGATIEETAGKRRVLGAAGNVLFSVDTDGHAPPFRTLRIAAPALRLGLDIETLPETSGTSPEPLQ